MLYEITVPEAGFSITEGTIIKWHKKVGDKVQEGETIVSVETDKIVVEIPSQCMGVLDRNKARSGRNGVPSERSWGWWKVKESKRWLLPQNHRNALPRLKRRREERAPPNEGTYPLWRRTSPRSLGSIWPKSPPEAVQEDESLKRTCSNLPRRKRRLHRKRKSLLKQRNARRRCY